MSRIVLGAPVKCHVVSMVAAGLMIHSLGRTSSAEEVDLSPRFELGATYHYVSLSRIDHEIHIDSAQAPEEIRVRTKAGMAFEVTRVEPDGSATIAWTLKYLSISADGMFPGIDGMLDYDSRKSNAGTSPLAPLFAGFIDNPVAVGVDASGNVVDFQHVSSGGLINPLGSLLQSFMSKPAFEQLPLMVTSGAPNSAKRGTTWQRTTSVEMPWGSGAIAMTQSYKVKRFDPKRGTAVLDMRGTLTKAKSTTPPAAGNPPKSTKNAFDVNAGSTQGTYVWNHKAGRLQSAETQLTIKTKINTLLGPANLTQEMSSTVKYVEGLSGE